MNEDLAEYRNYFQTDLRVELCFPRHQNDQFREWAVVTRIEDDLVGLQLSRDSLPQGVTLETGAILDLRLGKGGNAFCCRAMVVDLQDLGSLYVRLLGEVIPDELRDFYRIDAHVPLTYVIPQGLSLNQVRDRWFATRYRSPDVAAVHQQATNGSEAAHATKTHKPVPLAANISGSGIRFTIPEELTPGDLIDLEIYLPLDHLCVVPVIGQVVHVNRSRHREGERPSFSTALQFLFIDERDRDTLVRFISTVQLDHLRSGTTGGGLESSGHDLSAHRRNYRKLVPVVALLAALAGIIAFLVFARLTGSKGEIENVYGRELKKYRQMVPWR